MEPRQARLFFYFFKSDIRTVLAKILVSRYRDILLACAPKTTPMLWDWLSNQLARMWEAIKAVLKLILQENHLNNWGTKLREPIEALKIWEVQSHSL